MEIKIKNKSIKFVTSISQKAIFGNVSTHFDSFIPDIWNLD